MIHRPEYTRVEKPNTCGKPLGGSSCLNYYTWIPGSAGTFDDWAPYGGEEWNWEYCRQYLYKPATYHDGWKNKGSELTHDVHNGTMCGLWKRTTSIYNRKRSSSWMCLEDKKNITVLSKTNSKRLLIDEVKEKCLGVELLLPNGETHSFGAEYGTIVSPGVFESPKLLMLSGIGRQSLLDHQILAHVFRLEYGNGLDHHLLRAGPEHDAAVSAYCWKNKGPYTSGLVELVGLDPFGPAGHPHFEIDFVPMFAGTVKLNIAEPLAQPKINLNLFANDLDIVALREGIRWVDDTLMTGEEMKDASIPAGAVRMGQNIEQCGVDGKLRVFSVEKLRVIDVSVIPVISDCRIQNSD
ncbi:hypothetical protein DL768_011525 [Monosporascus sp. mg162]|nr:hypothetical protein DL768_011525 [Monosporascus sp. mg162]